MATNSAQIPTMTAFCTECGRPYPPDDLVRFGSNLVCADCKPRFVQRMREGVAGPSTMVYGGFWLRFLAVLLDGVIVAVVSSPLYIIFGLVGFQNSGTASQFGLITVTTLLRLTLACAYYVYFWSQKGATPGKMILGLRVVTATGEPISVGRAFGRCFAQILSGLILGIGYIIAAFDAQKRALHDHICSTRVIRVT